MNSTISLPLASQLPLLVSGFALPILGGSLIFHPVINRFIFALVDFVIPFRARLSGRSRRVPRATPSNDFTILVPIFGSMSYLKNVDFLSQYGKRVILCTTSKETSEFNEQIEALVVQYGFRVFRSDVPTASRTQWRVLGETVMNGAYLNLTDAARDEIIRDSIVWVDTTYCIFLDGDTVPEGDLASLTGAMIKEGFDVASVRVLASRTETLIEKLQDLEYKIAMDARRVQPWLTSGAAMVAKTSVMAEIMTHHSLFFSGGDIEVGKLAKMMGFNVGYIPFVFLTDVPPTYARWFRQRRAWFGGHFRHSVVNFWRFMQFAPFAFLYHTVVVWGLLIPRWHEAIVRPEILPQVVAIYWVLMTVFHWRYRSWLFLIFPAYAFVHVMIVLPMGVYSYAKMAYRGRNVGVIRLRGRTLDQLPNEKPLLQPSYSEA